MLFFETIDTKALGLLTQIQQNPNFEKLRLVGGTALALQLGHRKSIDLDLFGQVGIEPIEINYELSRYGKVDTHGSTRMIQHLQVNRIRVDIVDYPYPWLDEPIIEKVLRLASCRDIAAMKLSAITNRGTRKDFVDVAFLLNQYSLPQMLGFYREKFSTDSYLMVLKSLVYFDDAEKEPLPLMIQPFDWHHAKGKIIKAVREVGLP